MEGLAVSGEIAVSLYSKFRRIFIAA